jgi:hypothetical protein
MLTKKEAGCTCTQEGISRTSTGGLENRLPAQVTTACGCPRPRLTRWWTTRAMWQFISTGGFYVRSLPDVGCMSHENSCTCTKTFFMQESSCMYAVHRMVKIYIVLILNRKDDKCYGVIFIVINACSWCIISSPDAGENIVWRQSRVYEVCRTIFF